MYTLETVQAQSLSREPYEQKLKIATATLTSMMLEADLLVQ